MQKKKFLLAVLFGAVSSLVFLTDAFAAGILRFSSVPNYQSSISIGQDYYYCYEVQNQSATTSIQLTSIEVLGAYLSDFNLLSSSGNCSCAAGVTTALCAPNLTLTPSGKCRQCILALPMSTSATTGSINIYGKISLSSQVKDKTNSKKLGKTIFKSADSNSPVFLGSKININGNQSLILVPDVSYINKNMLYKGIKVANPIGNPTVTISSDPISSINFATLNNKMKLCVSGATDCMVTSTCQLNTSLNAGDSCTLWFKALQNKDVGFGPFTDTVNITINASPSSLTTTASFTFSYKNYLYAGGTFTTADSETVNSIARWDGSSWSPLGSVGAGVTYSGSTPVVYALKLGKDGLYIGGSFNALNTAVIAYSTAFWDGNALRPVGLGFSGNSVNAFTLSSNNILTAGKSLSPFFQVWNNLYWKNGSRSTSSIPNKIFYALTSIDAGSSNYIVSGGNRSGSGDYYVETCLWDSITNTCAAAWSALGANPNRPSGIVRTLGKIGTSSVIVGGDFTNNTKYCTWDTANCSAWANLASNTLNNSVRALLPLVNVVGTPAVTTTYILAGGSFTSPAYVAKSYCSTNSLPCGNWVTAGGTGSPNAQVNALASVGTTVFAGGQFSASNYISQCTWNWNGASSSCGNWNSVGGGVNGTIYALTDAPTLSLLSNSSPLDISVYQTHQYLLAKELLVTNNGSSSITLNNVSVTVSDSAMANKIKYCSSSSGNSCYFASSCSSGTVLSPSQTCSIWLQVATVADSFSSASGSATVVLSGTLGGATINKAKTFNISYKNDLYIGGIFDATSSPAFTMNSVGKWDGTSWSSLPAQLKPVDPLYPVGISGAPATAYSSRVVKTFFDGIYFGGNFTIAGGMYGSGLARWDGYQWAPIGKSSITVSVLDDFNNDFYVGGFFNDTVNNFQCLAKLSVANTATLTTTGITISRCDYNSGYLGYGLYASQVYNGRLYLGGNFSTINGVSGYNGLAMSSDGTSWSALCFATGSCGVLGSIATPSRLESIVLDFAPDPNFLYIVGDFTNVAGAASPKGIAKWSGTSWLLPYGFNGFNNQLSASVELNNNLYLGGYFSQDDASKTLNYIAKLNAAGTVWDQLPASTSPGLNANVYDLEPLGSWIFAGGHFSAAKSGISLKYIAKWDGNVWSPLADGFTYSGAGEGSISYLKIIPTTVISEY